MKFQPLYLFQSKRLGFRNWLSTDITSMAAIDADVIVMEFFPDTRSEKQTKDFIERMQNQFAEKEFCYFAVDLLENEEFIGFIGLSEQTFESDFTPCIDIGWRLKRTEWNKGLATEGAKRCLDYAFMDLGLKKVYAITPEVNLASERVMIKVGMKRVKSFKHSKLNGNDNLETCVLYEIEAKSWKKIQIL